MKRVLAALLCVLFFAVSASAEITILARVEATIPEEVKSNTFLRMIVASAIAEELAEKADEHPCMAGAWEQGKNIYVDIRSSKMNEEDRVAFEMFTEDCEAMKL